jgi:hypothetical protein
MEAVRIAEWQAMWAQGMTAREIGEATGWKRLSVHASIAKFRARGYDFPSRRPPHMVEVGRRMTQARQERAV